MEKPTKNRILEKLHYVPETGQLFKLVGPSGRKKISTQQAGGVDSDGYRNLCVDYADLFAHQIVWLIETGEYSTKILDHINGVKDDNRFSNLRETTNTENCQNRKGPNRGKAHGLPLGVYPSGRRFYASIRVNGQTKKLGTFDTPEEAASIYLETRRLFFATNTL